MTKKFFIACLLLASAGANAQTDSSKQLNEIVVTANRFPQKQVNTGKVMTVINKQEIERSPFASLGELLARQSGITIIGANNAPGTNNDLYVRGGGTGKTLVLVDGFPAYDGSTIRSTFDLNFLPLGEVERIEILKGGQSTLYGSDAVAGVVNIITRKNESGKPAVGLHLSAGSFGTRSMDLSSSGTAKNIRYKLQYTRSSSDGFSAALDTSRNKSFDKDGMKQSFLLAQFSSASKSKWSWNTGMQWSQYNNDLDESAFKDAKDFTVENQNLQFNAGIARKLEKGILRLNYSLNNSSRNYLDDSVSLNGFAKFIQSDYKGRSSYLEALGNIDLSKQVKLLVGLEHRWQNTDQYYLSLSNWGKYENTLSDDSAMTTISSGFASAVYNNERGFNLESGIRFNQHSRFGNNMTYTLNPSYIIAEKFKIAFNLSSAFTAPTLYQLYDGYAGNRGLNPETSVSTEVSLQYVGNKAFNARITGFSRTLRNGIDYDFINNKYFNNAIQKDRGLELEAGYAAGKWNIKMNHTLLKGEVTTTNFVYNASTWSYTAKGDTTYSHLFRVPQSNLNLSAGYQLSNKIYLSIAQRFAGKRFEPIFGGKPKQLDAFNTTDVFAQYQLGKKIRLYAGCKNIFNQQYQEVMGYTARGRNYVFGVRF
jgi:vitamin B12 transporter